MKIQKYLMQLVVLGIIIRNHIIMFFLKINLDLIQKQIGSIFMITSEKQNIDQIQIGHLKRKNPIIKSKVKTLDFLF